MLKVGSVRLFTVALVSLVGSYPVRAEAEQFVLQAKNLKEAQKQADKIAKDTWPNRTFKKAFVAELTININLDQFTPDMFKKPKPNLSH